MSLWILKEKKKALNCENQCVKIRNFFLTGPNCISSVFNMTFRAWLALLSFYLLYLLVGGYIFHTLEMPNDCKNIKERYKKSQKLNKIVQRIQNDSLTDFQKSNITELLKEINEQFRLDNSGVHISDLDSSIPPNCTHVELKWNFASSLLFAFTSITTIGYGQLAPATILGKLICLVYCLLGVPINAFLITSIGTYFQGKLKKFMSHWSRGSETKVFVMKIIFQVLIYLILGPLLFILVPALVLIHIEVEWSYVEAIYFSFITLTTIGFGDLVPGKSLETLNRLGNWEYVYLAGIWNIRDVTVSLGVVCREEIGDRGPRREPGLVTHGGERARDAPRQWG